MRRQSIVEITPALLSGTHRFFIHFHSFPTFHSFIFHSFPIPFPRYLVLSGERRRWSKFLVLRNNTTQHNTMQYRHRYSDRKSNAVTTALLAIDCLTVNKKIQKTRKSTQRRLDGVKTSVNRSEKKISSKFKRFGSLEV